MPSDHPLNDRHTDACPAELLGAVQALKYAKQLVDVRHAEAHTIVSDRIHVFDAIAAPAHLDDGIGRFAAVLECVGNKVYPDLTQKRTVGFRRRQ
jgi:ribonuclease HI